MNFHFLHIVLADDVLSLHKRQSYHLEGVELLLDLLRKQRSQSIARGNFTAAVVLLARPGVMKDYARRECRIALGRWGVGGALAVLSESQSRHEIVFTANSN